MSLIKTRPKVRLVLPTHVFPGDEVRAEVLLDARRPVEVGAVSATLEGYGYVATGAGEHRRSQRRHLVGMRADLTGPAELPKGRTKMPCIFRLPQGLPPTYDATAGTVTVRVAYEITVHVDIPWWPDRKVTFVMVMQRRPERRLQPDKKIFSPNPEGPRRQEAHIEVALDDTLIVPGGTLRGQLAPYNVAYNRYGRTELALVGFQRVQVRGRAAGGEALRYTITKDLSQVGEAEAVPFAMKLPDRLPPTFSSELCQLQWSFETKARYDFVRNLTFQVPVEVLPSGSETKRRQRQAPLVIGSERIRTIWSTVAQQHGFTYDEERGTLHATERDADLGETDITIRREHRGAEGIFLSGSLAYPALQLGLDGGSASSLRRVVGGGVTIGDERWDRDHYLTSREHAQLRSLLQPVSAHLLPLRLYDIDDTSLTVHHRDAGQSPKQLQWFAQATRHLARALSRARARVVPPAAMAELRPAWEDLARRLDAPLQTTCMAVEGRIDATEVRIVTEWAQDETPTHTTVEVRFRDPVADRFRLAWDPTDGLRRGDLEQLSPSARARWQTLLEGALAVDVERDHLVVVLPAPSPDPALLYQRAEAGLALYAALMAGQGPYR